MLTGEDFLDLEAGFQSPIRVEDIEDSFSSCLVGQESGIEAAPTHAAAPISEQEGNKSEEQKSLKEIKKCANNKMNIIIQKEDISVNPLEVETTSSIMPHESCRSPFSESTKSSSTLQGHKGIYYVNGPL